MTTTPTAYPYPNVPATLLQQPFVLLAGPDVIEGDGSLNERAAETLAALVEKLQRDFPITFYFKSSFDKANRTSLGAYRGPGLEEGLKILARIKANTGVKVVSDIHTEEQATAAGEVIDLIQIPAFLSRQTDLLVAAAKTGRPINLKKGQFLSPHDIIHAVKKIEETAGNAVWVTERGATFGYNNLVVDMRNIPIVQSYGYPLILDATHSVQLPGGQGGSSGGCRDYAIPLATAAVAAGANGFFFETHPDPNAAPCDGPNMIPLAWMERLMRTSLEMRAVLQKYHPELSETTSPQLAMA